MGQFDDKDVFIAGYPKSGNTWMQNLVTGIAYQMDPAVTPDSLIQEVVPDVHYRTYYRRYATPMFFKTHDLPRPEYRKVVYLIRDGRDAMVSYFHHLTALEGREIDFLRMVKTGEGLAPAKWHKHVEAWGANPYRAEMLVIKYEDLLMNGLKELQRFCAFVGIDRDESFLKSVLAGSSFTSMRQKEEQTGWEGGGWPKDKPFVRRGKVGSYKDEMSGEVLEAFLADAADTLRKYQYD
jgi:hypothetical protein